MKYRDKTYLTKQYCGLNKTVPQIAIELGVSKSTVFRWTRQFGIETGRVRPRINEVKVKCYHCEKELVRYNSTLSKKSFCNHDCYHTWMVGNTTGENCNNWQGGITAISSDNLKTPEFRAVRIHVKEDFPVCVLCNTGENLHVHHIKTRREFPELAFERSNLITLCRTCHSRIRGREREWEDHFVSLVCKIGELRENLNLKEYGNPQPSRSNVRSLVGRKVQRLMGEESQTNNPNTSADLERDEIVRACGKP